jgi:hypothetical protein
MGAAVALTMYATGAHAVPISVPFVGQFDVVGDASRLQGGLGAGSTFSGFYTVDTAATLVPAHSTAERGLYALSPFGELSGTIGGVGFSVDLSGVSVWNDISNAQLLVPAGSDKWQPTIPGITNPLAGLVSGSHAVVIVFGDSTGAAVDDTSYFVNQDFSLWDIRLLVIADGDTGDTILMGTVVPEPTTAVLLALGLGGMSAWSRSRHDLAQLRTSSRRS